MESKNRWDDAVTEFHDYLILLWTEYKDKDAALLDDEEKEVKDSLNALVA
jgi:hypothetical protein